MRQRVNPYVDVEQCALCGSPSGQTSEVLRLNEEQRLLCCGVCGLLYNDRRRVDVEHLYGEDYYEGADRFSSGGYFSYGQMGKAVVRTDRFASSFIRAHRGKRGVAARLLDIGCGYGFFLRQFEQDEHMAVVGVEASPKAAAEASKTVRSVICARFEDVEYSELGTFDFVVAFEVIEHLSDPVGFMRKVHHLLREGGHVFMSTPDVGSFWFRLLKRRWPGLHPHHHHMYFSKKTLRRLAESCGFQVLVLRSRQYYYTHVRHVRKRMLELFPLAGKVFSGLKPFDAATIPFLNGGDLQVILTKGAARDGGC